MIACDDFESALRQADGTRYGLQASVFAQGVDRVFTAIKRLNFGGVVINDTPAFRADHMPDGGNRQSGLGREGVRYAMEAGQFARKERASAIEAPREAN